MFVMISIFCPKKSREKISVLMTIALFLLLQGCTNSQSEWDQRILETGSEQQEEAPPVASGMESMSGEYTEEAVILKNEEYVLTEKGCQFSIADFETTGFYMEDGGEITTVLGVHDNIVYFEAVEQTGWEGEGAFRTYICSGDLTKDGGPVSILCEMEPFQWRNPVVMIGDSIYVIDYTMNFGKYYSWLWKYDVDGSHRIVQEWVTVKPVVAFPCGKNLAYLLRREDNCQVCIYNTEKDSSETLVRTEISYDYENTVFTGDYIASGGSASSDGIVYSIIHLDHERQDTSEVPADVYYYDLADGESRFLFTSENKSLNYDLTGDEFVQFRLEYRYPIPLKAPFVIAETNGITQRIPDPDLTGVTSIGKCVRNERKYFLNCSGVILAIDISAREITKYYAEISDLEEDPNMMLPSRPGVRHDSKIGFVVMGEGGEWICVSYNHRYLVRKNPAW